MIFTTLALFIAAAIARNSQPTTNAEAEPTTLSSVTYCTSTLTVPYPTPCPSLCREAITKNTYTESISCAGCKYLATSTAAPENGEYCPIAACASPIPTFYDDVGTTTVTSCHPTTPWPGAGPSKK